MTHFNFLTIFSLLLFWNLKSAHSRTEIEFNQKTPESISQFFITYLQEIESSKQHEIKLKEFKELTLKLNSLDLETLSFIFQKNVFRKILNNPPTNLIGIRYINQLTPLKLTQHMQNKLPQYSPLGLWLSKVLLSDLWGLTENNFFYANYASKGKNTSSKLEPELDRFNEKQKMLRPWYQFFLDSTPKEANQYIFKLVESTLEEVIVDFDLLNALYLFSNTTKENNNWIILTETPLPKNNTKVPKSLTERVSEILKMGEDEKVENRSATSNKSSDQNEWMPADT